MDRPRALRNISPPDSQAARLVQAMLPRAARRLGLAVACAALASLFQPYAFSSSATLSSLQVQQRAAAPAPVTPTIDTPGAPSSPDPRRMGEAVRWLMDEEAEKPPEWHVLLLDKTFEIRKNTVYRVTSSLMSELPLTLAEARTKAEHARDNFFSILETTPEWSKAIRTAQAWNPQHRVEPRAGL
ncbi:unnamed protein product [Effrenium voratum]|uniref:Uncharacterized protein n=1 Tax=Effrenium voratum TaxID=2562239 RepID=A0AA36JK08_9DINO|nr:unnamed protein product [Effrenium voratum]